ncbi:hypothetical protein [Fluviispira sanaruensis]|uniref:Uncharacterized protein n=1 Tax=Fluviispira sanaruensis TaxID=2493639 RepID=A0A4P2VLI2_FLUSA|nr:hypothetical protein [Fluviispira sanaruensis]BBH54213.1 hypothetical protein JCM31447_26730 [Fluviispira sanaruensis]
MTSISKSFPTEYSMLVHLFLDLRGRGLSLSSADLDILKSWEDAGLKPEFIAQVMFEYAEECKHKARPFPSTLVPLSRRVHTVLIKSTEF